MSNNPRPTSGSIEDMSEISSENWGPAKSRSAEDIDLDGELGEQDEDVGDGDNKNKKKKRKKYHRHTSEQIRELEALFKESAHPDEKQRQQLSKQLGLAPRQVKFWFQNRRTQIKAILERREYSLLRGEIEKLRDENKAMRERINKSGFPNCGRDATLATEEEQQLRNENARLKSEVEKLRAALVKCPRGTAQDQEKRSSLDKSRIMEIVNQAMEELQKMATAGEPLWVPRVDTGRETLKYDEYIKEFNIEISGTERPERSIEASRETGVVFVGLPKLVQSFMDVNQWKEMFPSMISKAATVAVINNGQGDNRNGAVQLMFAELQMLTPLVPTRGVYFVRCSKQLSAQQWAVVDVSIDKIEDNIDASLVKCRKRPSGCIIEDKLNGHCKVIWVEHLECPRSAVETIYWRIVNSGQAFGARHWLTTLQLQCERLVLFMATNVPMKDSTEVATLAGRKSILKMAQRMTSSFCRAVGASSYHTWTKITSRTGDDIRIASRMNLNDPGEPLGVILCAVSSVWLPVSPYALFDFLRDETRRNEWDIMLNGGRAETIANLSKGQACGNAVTIQPSILIYQTMKSKENSMWILQDSCINAYESMVVYAPVDITGMQSVMTGCDSSNMAVLSSGFSILPEELESRQEYLDSHSEGGTLLTIAFQVLTNTSPTAKLTVESVESANTLISCTLKNIKTSLQC